MATPNGQSGDPTLVAAMAKTLQNRGPDALRVIAAGDGRAVFAMTTLSIVDPGYGYGPVVDSDSGVMLTYNGEIYGFRELAAELDIPLSAHETDTHFLLKAYLREGLDLLARIDGMYAAAIHDPRRSATYLVRDRIGQKAVYYRLVDGALHFGSEVKALLEGPGATLSLPLAVQAVELPVGRPSTPYAGIELLAPGTVLRYDHLTGRTGTHVYWDLGTATTTVDVDPADTQGWIERYARQLAGSVARHRDCGDQALLLSGGTDSGVLAYLLRPSVCVTVRYPGYPEFDESDRAARIARDVGARLVVVEPTAADFVRTAGRIVTALDYPLGNASLLPEYLCYRAVAQTGLRVVSAGVGPDEYLLGYVRHLLALFGPQDVLDAGFTAYTPLAQRLRHAGLERAAPRDRYLSLVLRGPDANGTVRSLVHGIFDQPVRADQAVTLVDQLLSLPALLLTADKLSSSFGLERRSPYLSRELLETSFAAPARLRAPDAVRTKLLLRAAARELGVPEWVVGNADKRGFASPVPRWLTGELSAWYDREITAALTHDLPRDLAALLHRVRRAPAGDRYDRTRTMALLWALWARGATGLGPAPDDCGTVDG
ncbi:asparagine synthetase B family protein [Micromonospora sp. NPDC050187]|uniref:asparagine synthetase B family protein n=1 Tax=Micromonospora sp. NPDC050187 TaxID=3364277 RepID=UPI003797F259